MKKRTDHHWVRLAAHDGVTLWHDLANPDNYAITEGQPPEGRGVPREEAITQYRRRTRQLQRVPYNPNL